MKAFPTLTAAEGETKVDAAGYNRNSYQSQCSNKAVHHDAPPVGLDHNAKEENEGR